ncbi:MAG: YgiQ family radical SAM protein [Anaerolineaceae bacterium 4572_32.2]|nr:MAG: YgiQ family radical SAM protein [Anaerolineaceae bacterium 4572_32.2]
MFIPTTKQELDQLGWQALDVILVTGDSYVDSPFVGVAVVGHVLIEAGYRVGIIAQPDVHSQDDIARLGEPELFWGVSGGCMDSLVANYTATKKRKRADDLTPGGRNGRRPNRAVIVYANLIRRYFKRTRPIVLGGVEASLRRIAHYDFWSDSVRRSILFDAKADVLVYGMAERTVVELAERLSAGVGIKGLRGICYISPERKANAIELPSYEKVAGDKRAFTEMFHTFYRNNDPLTAQGLCQQQDTRYLIQNPPARYLTQQELDQVYEMDFERAQHPFYERLGPVKALETIKFSLATHRGCYGECNFCSIAVHQGRTVRWRSEGSIVRETRRLAAYPDFKGYIQDVGGPTANMYGFECQKKLAKGSCEDRRCVYPQICPQLKIDHSKQIALLRRLRKVEGVKKVFVASGIRYDLVLADRQHGVSYLREVARHHVSGQMKVAPEHTVGRVLRLMGKPGTKALLKFRELFYELTQAARKKQFLTYYLIAAHPGCTERDMRALKRFASRELRIKPEQVQIFTPTPSTYSSLMYHTEMDPFTGKSIFVEKELAQKERQKEIVVGG